MDAREDKADAGLAAMALRYHMLRKEDLQISETIQMEQARGKRYQPLGDILVELGFLTGYQLKRLRSIEEFHRSRAHEWAWAGRAAGEGFFSAKTLNRVRARQAKAYWKDGVFTPLRELLVSEGVMGGTAVETLISRHEKGRGEGREGPGKEETRDIPGCSVRFSVWNWRSRSTGSPVTVAVFRTKGDVDANNSEEFQRLIEEAMGKGFANLVVDLGETEFVSSAGLGVLFAAARGLGPKKGGMRLVGLTPAVRKVIEYLGFQMYFEIFGSVREAVESF